MSALRFLLNGLPVCGRGGEGEGWEGSGRQMERGGLAKRMQCGRRLDVRAGGVGEGLG